MLKQPSTRQTRTRTHNWAQGRIAGVRQFISDYGKFAGGNFPINNVNRQERLRELQHQLNAICTKLSNELKAEWLEQVENTHD